MKLCSENRMKCLAEHNLWAKLEVRVSLRRLVYSVNSVRRGVNLLNTILFSTVKLILNT